MIWRMSRGYPQVLSDKNVNILERAGWGDIQKRQKAERVAPASEPYIGTSGSFFREKIKKSEKKFTGENTLRNWTFGGASQNCREATRRMPT